MVRGIGFLTIKEIHFHGHVITVQLSILVDHMIPDLTFRLAISLKYF